jgi:hypothetical protein
MAVKSRLLLIVFAALVCGYAAIVISSLPKRIGRQHPEIASLFSPPWFNYAMTYTDGVVLGFRVGSNRAQLREALLSTRVDVIELITPCGNDMHEARVIPGTQSPMIFSLRAQSVYGCRVDELA